MPSSPLSDLDDWTDRPSIETLKLRSACLFDYGDAPGPIAERFTPDAIWNGDGFGVRWGRAAIRTSFEDAGRHAPARR